jgi:tetratricopeptide (TPR) repeat protein
MPIVVLALRAGVLALTLGAAIASVSPARAETSPSGVTPGGALDFGSVKLPPAAPLQRNEAPEAATYERCMGLARSNPTAAQKLAQEWQGRGGAHPAAHCFAVALLGLKQYKDAATRLEALGQAMVHAPAELRAEVWGQAGQAWMMASDPPRAYAADTAALGFAPNDADLLVDRAEAAGNAGWFDKAAGDLDQVLKAKPDRVDALVFRASAYRRLGRLDEALADAERAVKMAPDSAPALLERGDIRRLKGDADGARQDWLRVAVLAPGSAAATAAKGNIERLDLK